MENLKNLFNGLNGLSGAKFININNYVSDSSGEIANHNILVNIKVMNAKSKDFETLKNADLNVVSQKSAKNLSLDIMKVALSEMLTSAEKNLSANIEDRSKQSQAQTDAYLHVTNAIKILKETGEVHIFGFANQKKVLKKGEYKTVNSSDKTLAKHEITKHLKLRSGKFRTFKLSKIESVTLSGKTLTINC